MKLPKPRNLIIGIVIGVIIVGMGLVVAQDQETLRVRTSLAATDPRFPGYLAKLSGHALTSGDRYTVLTNGDAAFPEMLAAIGAAQHRVAFEGYIYDSKEDIARRFTDAFVAAAQRGVEVRLVFDAFGAKLSDEDESRLEDAGCRIGWFNKVRSRAIEEVNYRTHRKALIVDGEVAFVGGIGIADQWARDTEKERKWRDTHIKVVGPAATDVEAAFNENWIETGGIVDPDVIPHDPNPRGPASSIVVWSSPEGGTNALKLVYLLSLAAARESIDIQSPYLITDASTAWSLAEARRRGVRIRMLVEGDITDAKPVKFAGRAQYEELMRQGIDIHEYQPTMMHTKAVIVDGILSIVGSANFDNRSFELNDELNVVVFDRAVANRLREDFERDLGHSKRLDLDSWRSRPLHIRAREKTWSLFGEVF
ncbi:MAG TPA: phospholipase D-like domain-containing protein [Vicinamibacterales bacterium]|nr:phospholipase D-like domain-containing protein [Vicinamibacterales bacterium]